MKMRYHKIIKGLWQVTINGRTLPGMIMRVGTTGKWQVRLHTEWMQGYTSRQQAATYIIKQDKKDEK